MAEARFHDACDALRAKLREVEDEGWVSVERDAASQEASAAGKSASGLAALRIVLQHVCQADQAVLSARPDAPDECYVVTCHEKDLVPYVSYTRDMYEPALTSKECAWRLCEELAESIAEEEEEEDEVTFPRTFELDTSMVQYRGDPAYVVSEARYGDSFEPRFWIEPTAYVLDGTIEGSEAFLDLRSLAALRVVAGPDKSFAKMFSAVVSLRETKMPRVLYAEHRSDHEQEYEEGFQFRDLFVGKSLPTSCLMAHRDRGMYRPRGMLRGCGNEGCQCDKHERRRPCYTYPPEILKLAAIVETRWRQLPKPRPEFPGGHSQAIARCIRATRQHSDARVVYDEDWERDVNEFRMRVAIRPLPLAAEADAVVKWGEGVETFRQQARRELDAQGMSRYDLWQEPYKAIYRDGDQVLVAANPFMAPPQPHVFPHAPH